MTDHAMIVEGLEISISALVQSINGLMKREEKLLENGQNARAREVRSVIERLYVLRNELILVLNRIIRFLGKAAYRLGVLPFLWRIVIHTCPLLLWTSM